MPARLSVVKWPTAISLWIFAALLPRADAALPEPPRGLEMTANSPDSITLRWYRQINNESVAYNVYFALQEEGPYQKFASVKERTATHEHLTAGSTYYYRVAAINADGESAQSASAPGFTIAPWKPARFPVQVAGNMCISLDGIITSNPAPAEGVLKNLVDGSDATGCAIRGECSVKIKLNPQVSIKDAAYLILNFRTDSTGLDFPSYDINKRSLKNYLILESADSTTGEDGTWSEVAKGSNTLLDGVVVFPNHNPKWIAVRNSGDLQLCRLDIFRSAPAGFRNDYWLFTGDSLVVQDLSASQPERHTVWFSDLVRQKYPDRYPIVVQAARGGEMYAYTQARMEKTIELLSPANGSGIPTGTIVCWETGFNDVGLNSSLKSGPRIMKGLEEALKLCSTHGLFMVPVRIEYSTGYLNPETLEPVRYNLYYNTLAVNLSGVDIFSRTKTPYACDPDTGLPFADYWQYTHENYATALSPKDGVHHTPAGCDGINRLWLRVAGKMIYKE